MRVIAAALLCLAPASGHAGAFNEPAGHGQVILSSTTTAAHDYLQANGVSRLPAQFTARERSLLIQYGLTNDLMAILKLSRVSARGSAGATYDGSGPVTIGLQLALPASLTLASRLGLTLAAQVLQHRPSAPMRQGTWLYGQRRSETEMRLLAGKSMILFGRKSFLDIQAGYRFRNDGLGREWHFDVTQGIDIAPATTLLLQTFTTQASARPDNLYALFEERKRQVSVVRSFGPFSLQVGAFRTLSGRRTYVERGGLVALWMNF